VVEGWDEAARFVEGGIHSEDGTGRFIAESAGRVKLRARPGIELAEDAKTSLFLLFIWRLQITRNRLVRV
jgi:hypothetical protein